MCHPGLKPGDRPNKETTMARTKKNKNPARQVAQQSRRRAPNLQAVTAPMGRDASMIKYNVVGRSVARPSAAGWTHAALARLYIPGLEYAVGSIPDTLIGYVGAAGTAVARNYSTARFQPGTTITWAPSVGFTTNGRIYLGFTDNPEVINVMCGELSAGTNGAPSDAYITAVKQLGNVVSHQVFEEFTVTVPTFTRRKAFDVNEFISVLDVDKLDRCCQTAMFALFEGVPDTVGLGSFMYHDNLVVEGLRQRTMT